MAEDRKRWRRWGGKENRVASREGKEDVGMEKMKGRDLEDWKGW